MIITCHISEPRAQAIESIPILTREREPGLVRVLYYLAQEADRFEQLAGADPDSAVPYRAYAALSGEHFDEAVEAVKRGDLR